LLKVKGLVTAMAIVSLSGCAGMQPIQNQITSVTGDSITYVFESKTDVSKLKFGDWQRSRYGNGWKEQRGVKSKGSGNNLLVTKFISNGTAESINEYKVEVNSNGHNLTLSPIKNRVHQDGLILPMPVPQFTYKDLVNFLSSTQYMMEFEVDSKFSSESVNANFKRLLTQNRLSSFNSGNEKIYKNTYFLAVEGAESKIEVETYPYRNGSKCTVKVVYYTKVVEGNKIVLSEIKKRIQAKITEIVNS